MSISSNSDCKCPVTSREKSLQRGQIVKEDIGMGPLKKKKKTEEG